MSFVLAYLADNYSLCFHAALQHFDPTRCSLQRLRIRLVVRVVMSPSNNDLVVPKYTSPPSGQKLVGWGKYGLHFAVPQNGVEIRAESHTWIMFAMPSCEEGLRRK